MNRRDTTPPKVPPSEYSFTSLTLPLGIAFALLIAMMAVSYFPNGRTWGFSSWAFYPESMRWLFFSCVVVAIGIVTLLQYKSKDIYLENRYYWLAVVLLLVLSSTAFILFPTQTHFLGDGYLLLSDLERHQPIIKDWEQGVSHLLIFVKSIVGGSGAATALTTYRIVSTACGILFVIVVAITSACLLNNRLRALLLTLGVTCCGQTLLFFGYVENYAPLALSVALFCLVGVLVAQRRLAVWWIVLPVLLSVYVHILGIATLAGAAYLIAHHYHLFHWIRSKPGSVAVVLVGLPLVLSLTVLTYTYESSLFLQLAIVPIVPHQFTVEGYTLFSLNHLADFGNLIFLLLPCLPLVIVSLMLTGKTRSFHNDNTLAFLAVTAACSLAICFVLDPKLGMPRDWDLFAFSAVPMAFAAYLILFTRNRSTNAPAIIGIILGLAVLAPRVATLQSPSRSLKQIDLYQQLDPVRNRNLSHAIIRYYESSGDILAARLHEDDWNRKFPERTMVSRGVDLLAQRQPAEAIDLMRTVIANDPTYPDAWLNIGTAFLQLGNLDSARHYIEIAHAMNPFSADVLIYLGYTYLGMKDLGQAKKVLTKAIAIDADQPAAYSYLSRVYLQLGNFGDSEDCLLRATDCPSAAPIYWKELAEFYLSQGQLEKAAKTYRAGLEAGLDSTQLQPAIEAYPELIDYLLR